MQSRLEIGFYVLPVGNSRYDVCCLSYLSNLVLKHVFQDSLELSETSAITDLKKHPER